MEHSDVEARLDSLLDGELDGAQAADIERHLATCDRCGRKRALLAALRGAIQQLPIETVSAEFTADFERRLKAEKRSRRRTERRSLAAVLSVAATLLLVVWAATMHLRSRGPSVSPRARAAPAAFEVPPGLDCGIEVRESPPDKGRPCASADSCGWTSVTPAALTSSARLRPICVEE